MISLNNFHSVVSPRQLLHYSFECKSLARVTRILHGKYISLIFYFTGTTTRRKSLPFATSVDLESLGKFGGEDVLQ